MTRDPVQTASVVATRSRGQVRAVVLGALVAFACSACAEDRPSVNSAATGGLGAAEDARLAAAPPMGYPWATGPAGASLPTASAKAPVVR